MNGKQTKKQAACNGIPMGMVRNPFPSNGVRDSCSWSIWSIFFPNQPDFVMVCKLQAPAQSNIPSCKFFRPTNLDTIPAKKTFKVTLGIKHLVTGKFTNPAATFVVWWYLFISCKSVSAPQKLISWCSTLHPFKLSKLLRCTVPTWPCHWGCHWPYTHSYLRNRWLKIDCRSWPHDVCFFQR